MARHPSLEELLAALRAAREDPTSETSRGAILRALTSGNGHAAGKAAAIVGQFELSDLAPDLVTAFRYFLEHRAQDPGCPAKAAIAEALYRLGHEDPEPFLRGLRCVQMEAVRGGKVDTAVEVRGASALGLVRSGYRDALLELAELLADREAPARISAARAIASRGGADGTPLLRFKVLSGDEDPRVLGECFLALLRLEPRRSLAFVLPYLEDRHRRLAEAAAVALGESRLAEAFEPLRTWSRQVAGHAEEGAALMALAALRRDEAFDHLVSLVRDGSERTACRAIEALASYRTDERLRERVAQAAAARTEAPVRKALARAFGHG
jgi:HEAT repeat protein